MKDTRKVNEPRKPLPPRLVKWRQEQDAQDPDLVIIRETLAMWDEEERRAHLEHEHEHEHEDGSHAE